MCECVTTSHGLLIHKASPRPCRVCSAPHTQAHATTLTHPPPSTHVNKTPPTHLVHTYKPSIPCHTHMNPRSPPCLFLSPTPAALLRLGWLHCCLSVVTDECVRSISSRLGARFQKTAAKRYKEPHANGVGELQRSLQCVCVCVCVCVYESEHTLVRCNTPLIMLL